MMILELISGTISTTCTTTTTDESCITTADSSTTTNDDSLSFSLSPHLFLSLSIYI